MPDLPPVIATYFGAPTDADPGVLGTIFTADAHVHDEANDYHGLAEIRAWRIDTQAKTPFEVRPVAVEDRGDTVVVRAEVSGAFPNSPVLLDHAFTLAGDRIAALAIG